MKQLSPRFVPCWASPCLAAVLLVGCVGGDDESGGAGGPGGVGGKADVTVGAVVSLSCEAQDTFVRRGDVTTVDVLALDEHGRPSRNYQVEVTPSVGARVVQRNKVIFDEDGTYEIRCCALDAALCDHGTVQVGELAPALSLSTRPFSELSDVQILDGRALSASGGVVEISVDGTIVTPDSEGRFQIQVPLQPGLNHYVAVATDEIGRSARRNAWAIGGPFGDLNAPGPDVVRLAVGAEAYPRIARLLEGAVKGYVLDKEELNIEAWSSEGGGVGYKWELHPRDLGLGEVSVDLSPHVRGVAARIVLKDAWFEAGVRTKIGFFDWGDHDAHADLRHVEITAVLLPMGQDLALEDVTVSFGGIDLEVSGVPSLVENFIVDRVKAEAAERLPEVAHDGLKGRFGEFIRGFEELIVIPLRAPLVGQLVAITTITSVTADYTGLNVGLSWTADGETDPLRQSAPGPCVVNEPVAAPSPRAAYEVAIGVDVFNAIWFALWQTGALDISHFVDMSTQISSDRIPQLGMLDLFLEPTLPPVARVGDVPGELYLDVGGIRLDAVLETDLGVVNLAAMVGASARVQLSAGGAMIVADTSVETMDVDVLLAPAGLEPEATRLVLEEVVRQQVLPVLAAVVTSLPIPSADLTGLGVAGVRRLRVMDVEVVASTRPNAVNIAADIELD